MPNNATLNITTPSDREILMTRDFDAPRKLVWATMSKPELLKRWLFGPQGWELDVEHDDMAADGTFRWVWRGAEGEMIMSGVYSEVTRPERIVRTEAFQFGGQPPMGEQLATLALAEHNGKTTLTLHLQFDSKEARDGAIASGMAKGVEASYNNLAEILATELAGTES
jgi:uncharacterized protein YndB with AHSA1/START domain